MNIKNPNPPPEGYFVFPESRREELLLEEGDIYYNISLYEWRSVNIADGREDKWSRFPAIARKRPLNPEGLGDYAFEAMPNKTRGLSKDEQCKLNLLGGLKSGDEKLLYWSRSNWQLGAHGNSDVTTYITYRPKDYYLTLDEKLFNKSIYNPQGLSWESLSKIPKDWRFLSKEEYERIIKNGGLENCAKHLLKFYSKIVNAWIDVVYYNGQGTLCTSLPEGYFLRLEDSEFNMPIINKQKVTEKTLPWKGFEIVEDLDYVIRNGDIIFIDGIWGQACVSVGETIREARNCHGSNTFVATSIEKENPIKREFKLGDEVLLEQKIHCTIIGMRLTDDGKIAYKLKPIVELVIDEVFADEIKHK